LLDVELFLLLGFDFCSNFSKHFSFSAEKDLPNTEDTIDKNQTEDRT
jgi:hypothetical protein